METIRKQIAEISRSTTWSKRIIIGLIVIGTIQLTYVFADVQSSDSAELAFGKYLLGFIKAILIEGSVKIFSDSVIRMKLAAGVKKRGRQPKVNPMQNLITAKKMKLLIVILASAFANSYYSVTSFAHGEFNVAALNWGQIMLTILFSAFIPYVVYALSVDCSDETMVMEGLRKEIESTRKMLEKKVERTRGLERKKYRLQLAQFDMVN
jgi:hypothetical protein